MAVLLRSFGSKVIFTSLWKTSVTCSDGLVRTASRVELAIWIGPLTRVGMGESESFVILTSPITSDDVSHYRAKRNFIADLDALLGLPGDGSAGPDNETANPNSDQPD